MKIVINHCYGGFSLSEELTKELGLTYAGRDVDRTDPRLIAAVEKDNKAASVQVAELIVAEIPSGAKYRIQEYDGLEWIELETEIEWSVAK